MAKIKYYQDKARREFQFEIPLRCVRRRGKVIWQLWFSWHCFESEDLIRIAATAHDDYCLLQRFREEI